MGSCYSINIGEVSPKNEDTGFVESKKDSKREKKKIKEYFFTKSNNGNIISNERETLLLEDAPDHQNKSLIPELFNQTSKISDDAISAKACGVVTSDSGIESLSTVGEDIQLRVRDDHTWKRNKRLSKRIERLSYGSCQRCGNFKLDDSALSALLADSYCLCGPRLAGKRTINPLCQTHNPNKNKSGINKPASLDSTKLPRPTSYSSPVESESKSYDGQIDFANRLSYQSSESLNQVLESIVKDGSSSDLEEKAPLACSESSNTIPRSLSRPRSIGASSRSLLTEILDITDSICRCEYYSNEICCSNHKKEMTREQINRNRNSSVLADTDDRLLSSENDSDSTVIASSTDFKSASLPLPKFVSFSEDSECLLPTSNSINHNVNDQRKNNINPKLSSVSLAVSSKHSTSESYIPSVVRFKEKQFSKLSSSLGSRGMLMSESSSDIEDLKDCDIESMDLDTLSRATSLSCSSIRQLGESSDNLCPRVVLEGYEYVVIPADTYSQMQSDLAVLRQELAELSMLMLQEDEEEEASCR